MSIPRITFYKATIEIVDDVRRAPVELRSDRRHVCGRECRQHKTTQVCRKHIRIEQGLDVTGFLVDKIGVKNQRRERRQDPWPRAQSVVSDIEPECCEQSMTLVLRREDALRDVATATRFSAGIPRGPPDHTEVNE